MSELTTMVSQILTSAGTLISGLFTPGNETTPAVLTAVAALPILRCDRYCCICYT